MIFLDCLTVGDCIVLDSALRYCKLARLATRCGEDLLVMRRAWTKFMQVRCRAGVSHMPGQLFNTPLTEMDLFRFELALLAIYCGSKGRKAGTSKATSLFRHNSLWDVLQLTAMMRIIIPLQSVCYMKDINDWPPWPLIFAWPHGESWRYVR